MRAYDLDSDTEFIWSETRGLICVSTLDDVTNPSIKDNNWKHKVACIGPGEIYDALKILGVKINGEAMKKLSHKIGDAFVLVNREGYCFLSTHAIAGPSFHAHFFRLNDLFDWSEYGVRPVISTVWFRSSLENSRVILDVNIENRVVRSFDDQKGPMTEQDEDDEPDYDVNQVVDERQMEIPPEKFSMSRDARQEYFAKLDESSNILPEFTPLDEEVGSIFPRKVVVHTMDGIFDGEMWSAVRAKMGKQKCIIGYYSGCHTRVLMDNGEAYFLPYNKGQTLTASSQLFVARMRYTGMTCLAFKYNDDAGMEVVG